MLKDFGLDRSAFDDINRILTDENHPLMKAVTGVIARFGTPAEINKKARQARELGTILNRMEAAASPYLADIRWLMEQKEKKTFISLEDYRHSVLGNQYSGVEFDGGQAVTLEISPLQYFPWFIKEARQALANKEIMPGRFIRLRKMKEQETDGELLAVNAAMSILEASCVESPETSGADGSNIHLGGPDTMAGYYGGIGCPNDYPVKWLEEVLFYYINYGCNEWIAVSYGALFLAMMVYRLGIDIGVKVSVTLGHDNPFHIFWTLMTGKLLQRPDGSTALVGLNFSNSVNTDTILQSASMRKELGFETEVRYEHHITEPHLGVVRQPYLRRDQLVEIADSVSNLSAKHEGGEPDVEAQRDHPSNHLENFRTREEILSSGEMEGMEQNYMDKHHSLNLTARALTEAGRSFIGAPGLHGTV